MIRRPPRSTQSRSSAASDVYKRQLLVVLRWPRGWTRRRFTGIPRFHRGQRIGDGIKTGFADLEGRSRFMQFAISSLCERVRATEHTPSDPFRVLFVVRRGARRRRARPAAAPVAGSGCCHLFSRHVNLSMTLGRGDAASMASHTKPVFRTLDPFFPLGLRALERAHHKTSPVRERMHSGELKQAKNTAVARR